MTIHRQLVDISTTHGSCSYFLVLPFRDLSAPSAGCLLHQSVVYSKLQTHIQHTSVKCLANRMSYMSNLMWLLRYPTTTIHDGIQLHQPV